MDSDSLDSENDGLAVQVTNKFGLTQQVNNTGNALNAQRKIRRKYADEGKVTEKTWIQDFEKEIRTLNELNTLLVKKNRQLKIDYSFYKKSYEELVEKKELANEKTPNKSYTSASAPLTISKLPTTSMANGTSERKPKSSNGLSQRSDKLLVENKNLKAKVENLNASITNLKRKNQKLESFKKQIDSKKIKFSQDSDELACLVKSTERKNRDIFTPEVLAKLGQLSASDFKF